MMCKKMIISELSTMFGCSEDELCSGVKTLFKTVACFAGIIFVTFLIAAGSTFIGGGFGLVLAAVFSFLMMAEIALLSTAFTFLFLLITLYYGAYFAAKGWRR
jgi:hypothetical protein